MTNVLKGVYKLGTFLIVLSMTLALSRIGNECHKMWKEMKYIRIEMTKANSTAKGCAKRVADEISTVRKEGTKVRVWFW